MNAPPFPWQADAWSRLGEARRANRLPHALLIAGPAGIGKRAFAARLSQALLCAADDDTSPCGECPGCRQYEAGTHPDMLWLGPPEPGKSIPVDAVREVIDRLSLSGQGTKVARIESAEAMTINAANSLLKTLEEPTGDAVLILVSDRSGRLPATIRSRCQRVGLGLPAPGLARQWLASEGVADPERWLARAGGAPLLGRSLAREETDEQRDAAQALLCALEQGRVPPDLVTEGDRMVMAARVTTLIATVQDLIRAALMPAGARLHSPEQQTRIAALAPRLDARMLFDYLDALYRAMPGASDSLRAEMQYQGLLADAAAMARTAQSRGGR